MGNRSRLWRQAVRFKLAADWLTWLIAIPVAYWLRQGTLAVSWQLDLGATMLVAAPTMWFFITTFGLHKQSWGHASLADAQKLAAAVFMGTATMTGLLLLLRGVLPVFMPRSIPTIAGILALTLMGGYRLTLRAMVERRNRGKQRTLVAGTNEDAILYARNLSRGRGYLVGFIDDDPTRRGVSYLGRPVLGSSKETAALLTRRDIDSVVIAWPHHSPAARAVEAACTAASVRCQYLAGASELLYGRMQRAQDEGLRDLLRRPMTQLDQAAIQAILAGKRILVTGAGGSIGSELARQIAGHRPGTLLLLSHDENSIFELHAELRHEHPELEIVDLVANVQDKARLDDLFAVHRPEVVFHAAAHKHVPLMEEHPTEAVRNNVGGSRNLIQCATEFGVSRYVNISTDKAVNPTNVMGSTKHVAEMLIRDAAASHPDLDLVSVRFGNVLGSRGSVIPTWERQIANGGPITLTDERMTRYFMLIPEAVQLVLQAAVYGGQGTTYVLDMGEPVRIKDMAEQLIRLHGYVPGKDIEIVTTGLRPGEKLYEELVLDATGTSPHPKILIEGQLQNPADFHDRIDALLAAARAGDATGVRGMLQGLVPGAQLTIPA